MPDMTDDPRYAQGLVPERTDVWTDEWVPANAFTIRGVIARGDGAKFSMSELNETVGRFLADHGVTPMGMDGFRFNWHAGDDLTALHARHRGAVA